SEDQRYAAVVDETIVEQMQWLADVARRVIVAEGEGSAHHGRGIEYRVVTKRLRDGAGLIRSRPLKVHMAGGPHRMGRAGGGEGLGGGGGGGGCVKGTTWGAARARVGVPPPPP